MGGSIFINQLLWEKDSRYVLNQAQLPWVGDVFICAHQGILLKKWTF
jgi:hypothetical protein